MPKMKVPTVGSAVKKTKKNGLKRPLKKFQELFGDSGDEEKEASRGFSLPDTWDEYRALAEQYSTGPHSKSAPGKSPQDAMTSSSLTGGLPSAPPKALSSDVGQKMGCLASSTPCPDKLPPAAEDTVSRRPKRACRLKPKLGLGVDSDFVGMSDDRSTTPLSSDSTDNRNGSQSPTMRTSHRKRKTAPGLTTPSPTSSELNWEIELKHFYKVQSSSSGGVPDGVRKRGVRCMQCSACRRMDDCGRCIMCRDKKKFGGPGVKKQACIHRKCSNLIRQVPLKYKPKKMPLADDSVDSSTPAAKRPKRMSKSPPVDYVSAFQPAPLVPSRQARPVIPKGGKDKDAPPTIQIIWPEEPSLSGVPLYFMRETSLPRPSMCLNCGSAGKSELLRCVVCCNMFHPFCVRAEFRQVPDRFCCPSCIFCEVCGGEAKENCVRCSVCKKCYHTSCLSDHRSHADVNSWRCVSCTSCMSCKTTSPGWEEESVWYQDYQYCKRCYELKEKGNYCPLCLVCYSDNDYDSKMMQCVRCDHWVHTHCEDISDQSYEVLGVLPDSVEFLCKRCGLPEDRVKLLEAVMEYVEDSLKKLAACVTRVIRYCAELGQFCSKIGDKDFPLIVDFHSRVKSLLSNVLDSHKSSSPAHKVALSCKKEYMLEVDILFPWLEEPMEEGGMAGNTMNVGGRAVNGRGSAGRANDEIPDEPVALTWPSVLTHDHSYYAMPPRLGQDVQQNSSHTSPPLTLPSMSCVEDNLPKIMTTTQTSAQPSNSTTEGVGGDAPQTEDKECTTAAPLTEQHGSPPQDVVETGARATSETTEESALQNESETNKNGEGVVKQRREMRRCVLCPVEGDAQSNEAGRLLPCGVDDWVHVNCAIWSAEVYEEQSGMLRCVHTAISRGIRMRCELCKETGATVGCCTSSCSSNYHFQCARKAKCVFLTSKQVFCYAHRDNAREVEGVAVLPEADITVARPIFVDSNPQRTSRKVPRTLDAARAKVQLGSVQVHHLGSLVEFSDSTEILIPNLYRATCEFWDVDDPHTITTYTLVVTAPDDDEWLRPTPPTPTSLTSVDVTHPDLGCPVVTVGDPLPQQPASSPSPWEQLRDLTGSLPRKKRKMTPKTSAVDSPRVSPKVPVTTGTETGSSRSSPVPESGTITAESGSSAVPKSKTTLVESKATAVLESRTKVVPESSPSIVPKPKTGMVPDFKTGVVTESRTLAPESKSSVIPESKINMVPESRTSVVTEAIPNVIPATSTYSVPESKTNLVPVSSPNLVPVSSPNLVVESIPAMPQVRNASFPVESASNILVYLNSNGSGLGPLLQGVKNKDLVNQSGSDGSVSVQVLIPASAPVQGSTSLSSLASSIKTIQTPNNHAFLNQLLASASRNPQVISCLNSLPPTSSSAVTSSTPSSSSNRLKSVKCFPNSSALKNFKIPKKSSSSKPAVKPKPKITSKATPTKSTPTKSTASSSSSLSTCSSSPSNSVQVSMVTDSEQAVASSVCLKRKRHGLSTTPCKLLYTITNSAGRKWTSYDLEDLWSSILCEVQSQRTQLRNAYAPHNKHVYWQFGLGHPLVVHMIEQLPHANRCDLYTFKYHRPAHMSSWKECRPKMNVSGCARSEPYSGNRSPFDMFSFLRSDLRPAKPVANVVEAALASASTKGEIRTNAASRLPFGMQYRQLQKVYKNYVGVFKSNLHGLGLFCTKEIDAGQMVIEYSGQLIRTSLSDPRERYYESKNIGCYMFGIDGNEVVDATMAGNEARFINHSCEPNCYSKIITIEGKKKIMIFAKRRLVVGEELTYDYKFPVEDCSKKIPCCCGSRKCRKYLN